MILILCLRGWEGGGGGGEGAKLPYKSDGGDSREKKFLKVKVPEFCFVGVVGIIFFYTWEVSNQLTDIYFLSYFSAQCLKRDHRTFAGSHWDWNTLRGPKPRILAPKRYDDHPRHFNKRVPPGDLWLICIRKTNDVRLK